MDLSWDEYFMSIAQMAAKKSHCYSRHVGAVIVKDKSILSSGFNGPPMAVSHCESRHPEGKQECPRRFKNIPSGQGLHLCPASHAEVNAIALAARNGHAVKDATLYLWTHDGGLPCKSCAGQIINAGVVEVVVCNNIEEYDEREESIKSSALFKEAGIKIRCLKNFN